MSILCTCGGLPIKSISNETASFHISNAVHILLCSDLGEANALHKSSGRPQWGDLSLELSRMLFHIFLSLPELICNLYHLTVLNDICMQNSTQWVLESY